MPKETYSSRSTSIGASMPTDFLLDTHTWIWLMTGNDKLPMDIVNKIQDAIPSSRIFVSIISVWEVSLLEAKGRLQFDLNCLDWIERALSQPGISQADISPKILVESSRLPGDIHGDPFDRALIATARTLGLTLVTKDKQIQKYSQKGFVKTLGF